MDSFWKRILPLIKRQEIKFLDAPISEKLAPKLLTALKRSDIMNANLLVCAYVGKYLLVPTTI